MHAEELKTFTGSSIEGPLVVQPKVFSDERGFFLESWNSARWHDILNNFDQDVEPFVQDNHSSSSKAVLRGLHYQLPPYPQSKLVRCISGEIFDVAIDLRKSSSTYLQGVGVYLTETNFKQLWIPKGFAHGFLTVSSKADVLYKTTHLWNPNCEHSIRWNDHLLAIPWPILSEKPVQSLKDASASFISDLNEEDFFK